MIPAEPSEPFDGSHLTNDEVRALTPIQVVWVDLTDAQWAMREKVRAPLEARPDRIPSPEDTERLKNLFGMVDEMHLQVHSPWGMPWVAVQAALTSLRSTFDWSQDAQIDHRYRYRIDAPLDPQAQVPDEIPKEWT